MNSLVNIPLSVKNGRLPDDGHDLVRDISEESSLENIKLGSSVPE